MSSSLDNDMVNLLRERNLRLAQERIQLVKIVEQAAFAQARIDEIDAETVDITAQSAQFAQAAEAAVTVAPAPVNTVVDPAPVVTS